MNFLWKLFCMDVKHERFWPMMYEIRRYARDTGLRIVPKSEAMGRNLGFETDCSEFKPGYRHWYIYLTDAKKTATAFDVFLDGERVQHPAQEEILRRYLQLWPDVDGREVIAEALSTGKHPTPRQRVAA
jgi:hypothetical protein